MALLGTLGLLLAQGLLLIGEGCGGDVVLLCGAYYGLFRLGLAIALAVALGVWAASGHPILAVILGAFLVSLGVLEVFGFLIVSRAGYEDLVSLLGVGILPTAAIGTWQAAREVRAHARESLLTGVLLLIVAAWLVAGRAAELAIIPALFGVDLVVSRVRFVRTRSPAPPAI